MGKVTSIQTRRGIQVGIPEENGGFTLLGDFEDELMAETFEQGVQAGIRYACDKMEEKVADARRRMGLA